MAATKQQIIEQLTGDLRAIQKDYGNAVKRIQTLEVAIRIWADDGINGTSDLRLLQMAERLGIVKKSRAGEK